MRLYDDIVNGENKLVVEGQGYEVIVNLDGSIDTIYEQRGSSHYIVSEDEVPSDVMSEVRQLVSSHIE